MAFVERILERRKTFKNIGDKEEVKQRREQESIQIRKREKDEQLSRRRKIFELGSDITGASVCFGSLPITASSIPQLVCALSSPDIMVVTEASVAIRKVLSIDRKPPIAELLSIPGVLDRMKVLLEDYRYPVIQLETCWSITNIVSGTCEQTAAVVESGMVPLIVKLLNSENEDLQEQAVWAIANIAGDRIEYRDGCIGAGAVVALSGIMETSLQESKIQLLRLSIWGFSNMCRGDPSPSMNSIQPGLRIADKVLNLSNDTEVLADCAWAFSYLTTSEGVLPPTSFIPIPRLVTLLGHPSSSVQVPVLRVVGNLLASEDSTLTQTILSQNVLYHFKFILGSNKKGIRKEALWAISNICAESQSCLQSVISTGVMRVVCDMVATEPHMDVRVEAVWSLCNACLIGSENQLEKLVLEFNLLTRLCEFLSVTKDTRTLKNILEALWTLLGKMGSSSLEKCLTIMEESGGMVAVEDLQHDESEEVYAASVRILEKYFNEAEVEKENEVCFDFSKPSNSRMLAPRDSDVARSG